MSVYPGQLESQFSIKLLFLVEGGSRIFGYASESSDYDVRGVFVHPLSVYLGLKPYDEVITIQRDNQDIVLFDIRKFHRLLLDSNPNVLEWVRSPIVYYDRGYLDLYQDLVLGHIDAPKLARAYKGIIKNNLKKRDFKAVINTIRAYFNLKYLITYDSLPPLNLLELVGHFPEFEPIVRKVLVNRETFKLDPSLLDLLNSIESEFSSLQVYGEENSIPFNLIDRLTIETILKIDQN